MSSVRELPAQTVAVQAPRDAARPGARTGTSIIRGLVADKETGVPLNRVVLRLTGSGSTDGILGEARETTSSAAGAFEFSQLPAGEYTLTADPTGARTTHLAGAYMDPRATGSVPQGRPSVLALEEGEILERVNVLLSRSYAISGRVFDEDGEPVADVRVEAERLESRGGLTSRSRTTDDLGAYRLWGFAPGTYRVCATPLSAGHDRQATEGLIRTCYPSVAEYDAQPIVITTGDTPEINIQLRRSRLFRISGVAVDASGAVAASARVTFVTIEHDSTTSRTVTTTGGAFTVRGVAPGQYGVRAELGNAFDPKDKGRQLGYLAVSVQAADVEDLVVTMTPPATASGRLVFEGGTAPAGRGITVRALAPSGGMGIRGGPTPQPVRVNADSTFQVTGLFGPHTLQVEGLPEDWKLKSVRYRGEERIHVPTEFRTRGAGDTVELVVTNRPARLRIQVMTDQARAVADAQVLVFPADARQWDAANVATIVYARDGTWEVWLRPADYLVMTVDATKRVGDLDRASLEALAKTAERITLLENEQRTIDLTLRR